MSVARSATEVTPSPQSPPALASSLGVFGFALLLLLALAIRAVLISNHPLHHDEGVNFALTRTIFEFGFYEYSHQNFHGPLFFYLMALSIKLLGDSEFALRFVSIVCGTALSLLPFLFRRSLGLPFALCTSLLLTLSPSQIFFARYAIHEPLVLTLTLAMAITLFSWLRTERVALLYCLATLSALLVCTKETFCISMFSLLLAVFTVRTASTTAQALRRHAWHFVNAFSLFMFIVLLIYSAGFQWMNGITELFHGLPQWIGRRSAASDPWAEQPFYYYVKLIARTEPFLLVAPFLAFLGLRQHSGNPELRAFLRFTSAWAVTQTLIYSLVSYKASWLVGNVAVPWYLALGTAIALLEHPGSSRAGAVLGSAALLELYFVYTFVFRIPYGPQNPFSLLHTTPAIYELSSEVHNYLKAHPSAKILVAGRRFWPLPYYFRDIEDRIDLDLELQKLDLQSSYDIILKEDDHAPAAGRWSSKRYQLSDISSLQIFFRDSHNSIEPSANLPYPLNP